MVGFGITALSGTEAKLARTLLVSILVGGTIGALIGGLVRALSRMDVPRKEPSDLNERVRAGEIIVTVRTEDKTDEVTNILGHNGGEVERRKATSPGT